MAEVLVTLVAAFVVTIGKFAKTTSRLPPSDCHWANAIGIAQIPNSNRQNAARLRYTLIVELNAPVFSLLLWFMCKSDLGAPILWCPKKISIHFLLFLPPQVRRRNAHRIYSAYLAHWTKPLSHSGTPATSTRQLVSRVSCASGIRIT